MASFDGAVATRLLVGRFIPVFLKDKSLNHLPSRSIDSAGVSRRNFIGGSAAALLATGVWSEVAAQESTAANEKLNILCIGTANRAAKDISQIAGENIIGLCDVDSNYLERAATQYKVTDTFSNYREMIDQLADKADAVVVATPDHHHFPASMLAIKAGLHVYCEKPLTHTVQEARLLTEAAREKKLVTQMGIQIHAEPNFRRVVELVQSGAIGDVTEVHVWVGKNWGGGELPKETTEAPDYLDWDRWLGPAAERGFASGRYHPAQWRRWWDFGQGTLGDMGCHYMDLPFWALDLKYPTSIQADGPDLHDHTCPKGLVVNYEFPGNENKPAVKLTWYDGKRTPREVAGQRVPGSGVMFIGTEGNLFASYTSHKFFPAEKFGDFEPPTPTIPDSIGHHAEWIKACKDGSPTLCNFDYSGPLTEAVLLGNVAYRSGQKLEWDAANLKATNCPEASALIAKQYREGWDVR